MARQVERLAAGHRMGAHHALPHRLEALALLLGEVEEADDLAREHLAVLAHHVLDFFLGLVVERIVAGAHVGELRVATLRRDADRAQQRVLGRRHLERAVGVPQPVADREQPPPVLARERLVVLVEVGDVGEGRRQARLVGGAQAGADRMLDRPQALGEGELLLVADVLLVAEHQHGVLVHAGMDGGHLGGRHRLGHVDAVDLARQAGTDLPDRDRHRRLRYFSGENLAGMASSVSWRSITMLGSRGGGQMPLATASPRMRSRSPMFL